MLYKKVMLDLKSRIDSDELNIGDMLPTEKALIEHYSVSRSTIRKAIDELVKLGLVEKRQGSGSSIVSKTLANSMSNLVTTQEMLANSDKSLVYKVVEFQLMSADKEIAEFLKVSPAEKIYFIRRIKLINEVPSIYEDSYIPVTLLPQINLLSLEGSKYSYLENELGFEIDGAIQDFEAIMPDQDICEALNVSPERPLIRIHSIGKLKDGRVFEYTRTSLNPETYTYKHYLKR
ncbi:GntR family transcriptional regulator [Vibrio ruber]|uniref:GntR family transcriptional regulator n=1 Tax=Vibrio ruber TaxID=184755 RepID=UPI00289371EE|nr:GntR family transcriptional regulator [Vibrio ruber]WNJ97984.1 GntR family transcriptional regulator [Vibrio ruber]